MTAEALKSYPIKGGEDIVRISEEMEDFNQRPDTIVSMPRIFQAWGRKL
jgi:hypothetical protein